MVNAVPRTPISYHYIPNYKKNIEIFSAYIYEYVVETTKHSDNKAYIVLGIV